MCQVNVGDSFIEKRYLNPDSERSDIGSLGAIMMELMKPTIYAQSEAEGLRQVEN